MDLSKPSKQYISPQGDKVSMLTHIYPHKARGRLKWSYAKSPGWQPTLCVALCLICWFALAYKKYGHTWHRMSLLRPGVIKQHKLNQTKQYISELLIIHKGKINPICLQGDVQSWYWLCRIIFCIEMCIVVMLINLSRVKSNTLTVARFNLLVFLVLWIIKFMHF